MISTQLITLNYPVINTLAPRCSTKVSLETYLSVYLKYSTNITNNIINDGSIVRLKDNLFNNL